MAGYRIPGPLRHDGEPIDEGTSALTRSSTPGPLGVNHCWPWGDRPDPELDYDSWGDRINREDLKMELAEEIAHLILDITGIFDPTPISDGNYALFCLAGGRWLDALVSTASIVPYIGDVSKIPRMLDYSRSIDKAIHLARIDITWRARLRTVLTPLRSLLDKALAIEDELPDLTRKYLQEMRYEIDDFVTPHSMRELKPKAPANIEHAVPRGPSKKAKSPKKEKTESETSEDALKEQSQDSKIGEKYVGGKSTTPDTDVVPNRDNGLLVQELEPGNPRSSSLPRNGNRLILDQGNLPNCGPNSCAMVLDSYGKTYDLNKLIVDSKVADQGAYMGDMAKALRNQGLTTARIRNRVSLDELARATAKGNPAVVATRLDRGGHAVVVDGITSRQGQAVVAIRDPALGRQYFTPLSEFADRFTGQAILTSPKP